MTVSPIPSWAEGAEPIAFFELPWTHTWGSARDDERKAEVREAVRKLHLDPRLWEWFAFYLVVHTGPRNGGGPDVDNHIKPVTDALTGMLYPDDDVRHVRAVAVDTRLVDSGRHRTQVWIYAKKRRSCE